MYVKWEILYLPSYKIWIIFGKHNLAKLPLLDGTSYDAGQDKVWPRFNCAAFYKAIAVIIYEFCGAIIGMQ